MEKTGGCKVYERIGLRQSPGEVIRPGGLQLTERGLRACAFARGARILDLGCGTGVTLQYMTSEHGLRAIGVEASSLLLKQAQDAHPALCCIRGVGEALPFAHEQMDGVLAECSLSVTGSPEQVLGEIARVLKRGGRLLVSDVYFRDAADPREPESTRRNCCLGGAVSHPTWLRRISESGFRVLLWEDHSYALKIFAAQLVLSHGFPMDFWCDRPENPETTDWKPGWEKSAMTAARPGYFLLVAERL